jgi:hypothetical protein
VSADYKLDPDKQVQNHWPQLLNDGGFILQYVSHSSETSTDSPIKIGDAAVFQPEGPCTSDGEAPCAYGVIQSIPSPGDDQYNIQLPDGTTAALSQSDFIDVTELDDPTTLPNVDPAQGDPIHPWHPAWLKPGQPVTHHIHGQRHLGHLHLTDNFCWAFTQYDKTGRRVLEIELPNLARNWKEFLDTGELEVGHSPSPWVQHGSASPLITKHTPTLAAPLSRGVLRSGTRFRGHAHHVSARGLTQPTPQFLWQSMKFPKIPLITGSGTTPTRKNMMV